MIQNKEVYISVDIEADGPIPGPNSMLSIGAAAFYIVKEKDGTLRKVMNEKTFSANLEMLPDAEPDPSTMAWWKGQPEAWKACRENTIDPHDGMTKFKEWVEEVSQFETRLSPVFVGYPAGYDFLFVYWYLQYFLGYSPFSFSALDIKSYSMAMMKKGYRKCTKRNMPKRWFDKHPHTHIAVEDAIGQGALFCNILMENLR